MIFFFTILNRIRLVDTKDQLSLLFEEEYQNDVVTSTSTYLSYYNLQHARDGQALTTVRKRFCLMPLSIYLRRHSYLTRPINEQILNLFANGLILSWSKIFVNDRFLRPEKMKTLLHEPRRLSMLQIEGAFQICGCLYCIAFLVFLLELFISRLEEQRRLYLYYYYYYD